MNLQTEKQDPSSKIKQKLNGLGITGINVLEPIIGPVVTGYPIQLPNGIPVSKLLNKQEDLALALNVYGVDIRRIDNRIVIFVPNEIRSIVDFKDALFWFLKDETVRNMELPILLGTNFKGEKAALDLAKQPHVLIAGSTGSGKSVFESAIIASLVTLKSPKELEIYLVDTKMVDLTLFSDLEHVKSVVNNEDDWYLMIDTLYFTVQTRMNKFKELKVRNITEFNKLDHREKMPHIVVIIDELADLIEKDSCARSELESKDRRNKVIDDLKKVIQICRASGIHIIACTQRTTVDVVSGTVKANFPTRIALRLPQSNDSRAILGGENGAENLLGKGDMLIKESDKDVLIRYHGPFVRLEDIESILKQRDMLRQAVGLGD